MIAFFNVILLDAGDQAIGALLMGRTSGACALLMGRTSGASNLLNGNNPVSPADSKP